MLFIEVALRYEFVSLASDEDDGAGNRIQLDYDVVFNNVKVRVNIIGLVTWTKVAKQKESLSLSSSNHDPSVKENIENSESYFITTGVTVTNGDTDEVKVDLFDVIENSQFWLVAHWRSIFVQIEYAWVSQEEVTAKSSGFWDDSYKKEPTAKYDLKIEHNIPDSFVLKAQETFNIVFEITNTNPVTHLEFDIS